MENDSAYSLALWQKLINGDQASLESLFDIFGKKLISYAYTISLDKNLAKDAVQDVFVDLWHYRSNLAQDVQVKFYLYSSVKRAVIKNINGGQTNYSFAIEYGDTDSKEAEWCLQEAQEHQESVLQKSMENLSGREREIISLKYYSNLKIKEIAKILNLKEQTVANTLQNALIKLRKLIKKLPVIILFLFLG